MEDYQISRADGPIALFQKHFASLTSSQEFADVTLVCRDLKPVALHRVVLSASSLWFRDLLPKLPDKPTIYLDNIDPLALTPLLAFIYGGEAKVAKTLLSTFMEAANILMIDGLSDKDRVEKVKENPVLLESLKEDLSDKDQSDILMDESELLETKLEEDYLSNIDGMSCDSCDFKTAAKSKHNQTSVMKRHKKTAHEEKDGIAEIVVDKGGKILQRHSEDSILPNGISEFAVDKRGDIFKSNIEESIPLTEGGLSCTICDFVTTAKSKGNQTSVMNRHNRKVHGNYEYSDIHLSDNLEKDPKEENIITLDEDLQELDQEEPSFASNIEESCHICGFKSVAKSNRNRRMVLKRHMVTAHESKSGEIIS